MWSNLHYRAYIGYGSIYMCAQNIYHSLYLQSTKAELGSSDSNGRTALHYAITEGVADCAVAILNAVVCNLLLLSFFVKLLSYLQFFLRGVLGWSINIMINSFFVPTRQESHHHVTGSQFTELQWISNI